MTEIQSVVFAHPVRIGIGQLQTRVVADKQVSMSFDAGFLVIKRAGDPDVLVPAHNVVQMSAAKKDGAKK